MTLPRLLGVLLLILVGYHYINGPIGLSTGESIGLVMFASCLTCTYHGYGLGPRQWLGWGLILLSSLLMASFSDLLTTWLPLGLLVAGFRFADLHLELPGGNGDPGGFDGGGSCDGGGGDC